MKIGTIVCIVLFVSGAVLALVQLWFAPIDWAIFVKVMITIGVLFVVVLGVTLAQQEYLKDKELKKSGYID